MPTQEIKPMAAALVLFVAQPKAEGIADQRKGRPEEKPSASMVRTRRLR